MEGYRSYPEPHNYPESRVPYSEGLPADPDYPEAAWYSERAAREPERYDDRVHREPERYEEPRREPPRPSLGESGRQPLPGARSAPPAGPGAGPGPAYGQPAGHGSGPHEEPPMPRRPVAAPASPGPAGDSVYRSKRPGVAALCWLPTALLLVPALLLLRAAAFADPASASGVVAAACLVLALPLLSLGLYAVATGAVRAAGPNSVQAWLRPPVAYLTVALVLFLAAGLAA